MSLNEYFFSTALKNNLISKILDEKIDPYKIFSKRFKIKENVTLFYDNDKYFGYFGYLYFHETSEYVLYFSKKIKVIEKLIPDNLSFYEKEYYNNLLTLDFECYSNIEYFDIKNVFDVSKIKFTFKKYYLKKTFIAINKNNHLSFESIISHSIVNYSLTDVTLSQFIGKRIFSYLEKEELNEEFFDELTAKNAEVCLRLIFQKYWYYSNIFSGGKNEILSFVFGKINKNIYLYQFDLEKYFNFFIKNFKEKLLNVKKETGNINQIEQILKDIDEIIKDETITVNKSI